MPRISVIMGAYNSDHYLRDAVDSILNQTFRDFRFIIVDDASTDHTASILASYEDPRICVLRNETNLGLPGSLNRALELVDSPFVARMDADDRCHPDRLRRQVAYLEAHPECGVLGTAAVLLLENRSTLFLTDVTHPYEPEEIKAVTIFSAALVHPSVMVNLEAFDRSLYFYRSEFVPAADYECWVRLLSQGVQFACLRDYLIQYRDHGRQMSRTSRPLQRNTGNAMRLRALELAGVTPNAEEFELHRLLSARDYGALAAVFPRVCDWFRRILDANAVTGYYETAALQRVLARRLRHVIEKAQMPAIQAAVAECLTEALHEPASAPPVVRGGFPTRI